MVGAKVDLFDVPVCNSFQATIVNDQLCYEADLNTFSNKSNIAKELESGFYFLMDYNEDRQVTIKSTLDGEEGRYGIGENFLESDKSSHAFTYLDTIGKSLNLQNIQSESLTVNILFLFIIEPVSLIGEGEYNLNALKEIKATKVN